MILLGFLGGLMLEWGTQILITLMVIYLFNRLSTRYPHFRLTLEVKRLANSLNQFRSEDEIRTLPNDNSKELVGNFKNDLEEISRMLHILEQKKRELQRQNLLTGARFDEHRRGNSNDVMLITK